MKHFETGTYTSHNRLTMRLPVCFSMPMYMTLGCCFFFFTPFLTARHRPSHVSNAPSIERFHSATKEARIIVLQCLLRGELRSETDKIRTRQQDVISSFWFILFPLPHHYISNQNRKHTKLYNNFC